MLRDRCYTFVHIHKLKFCVHKNLYIVHCCADNSILMHYGDHGAEFGVLTKFSDFSNFNVTTDTVNPYKSI